MKSPGKYQSLLAERRPPFSGDCIGGPLDKRQLAHWQATKKLYRPAIAGLALSGNAPIMTVEIGEYRLNDFGQWHWWPTAEGKAMDTLLGPAVHS